MQTTLPAGDGIRWPEGRQIAVLLTFDFDADRLQSAYFRQEDLPFADRSRGLYGPDEGLPRILSMLSRQNVPATFFVPGVICRRRPRDRRPRRRPRQPRRPPLLGGGPLGHGAG